MTILRALNGYYDRMAARGDAEMPGWSREKITFALVINRDGRVVDVADLRVEAGRKRIAPPIPVPAAVKRTVDVAPNFLWDKTAYVLGRTGGSGHRTAAEHAAFRDFHSRRLAGTDDEGLAALLSFLDCWTPDRFDLPPFTPDLLDTNLVFRLDGDGPRWLHERPAACALVEVAAAVSAAARPCLVTGADGEVARLHPAIKGVEGAQSSGASLVSFNLDAFTSYGAEQGDNAPTSRVAAFRYGTALNRLLDRGSANRLRTGDATVVFWADARDATPAALSAADAAEDIFGTLASPPPVEDEAEASKLGQMLDLLRAGRPVVDLDPRLTRGVRFHVLGLAPNAARLSVRFWLSDDIEVFAQRLADHYADCRVEPLPWRSPPSVNLLLARTTALQEDFKNIPSLLAGEVARAVLGGGRYPQSLLAATLIRLRAGDDPASGWHAATIRAVLARDRRLRGIPIGLKGGGPPVSLKRDHDNIGYQLGRLFAVFELAQRAALGQGVNATIRDKYFGAAAATPASVFPLIIAGGQNHLSKVRKTKPGWGVLIEREIEEIIAHVVPAEPSSLPRSLKLEDQGEFAIGYYHQRRTKLGGDAEAIHIDDVSEGDDDND